ncbi:hypothetical protein [Gemmata palustris]|nr:hypothetical protein [Gemmata palustris]
MRTLILTIAALSFMTTGCHCCHCDRPSNSYYSAAPNVLAGK